MRFFTFVAAALLAAGPLAQAAPAETLTQQINCVQAGFSDAETVKLTFDQIHGLQEMTYYDTWGGTSEPGKTMDELSFFLTGQLPLGTFAGTETSGHHTIVISIDQ